MANYQIPDEDQIASLLEHIQPQPGAELRARVANATWANSEAEQRRLARQGWFTLRWIVIASLAMIGVLIIFFAIPPFNGIARRVTNFFNPIGEDSIPFALTSQSPSRQFPLTVSEAATQAGFTVHQPDWVPEGFQLNGAAYDIDQEAVILDYHSPIPGKFLRLTQRQTAENRLSVGNIGASAEVQILDIHTSSGEIVAGEYVAGAWRIPSMLDHLQTGQPDMTATMQANWDPNAKIHMLRWEIADSLSGGFLYEIIHADQTLDTLSAEMLVKIAESMK
ncbi:MAG TPA: hypothetical protein VI451_11330 [Anaerolineales bacterium]|nr:hypothetical protein [Anaerolineales bacterium]